jgi:hypothetical protein
MITPAYALTATERVLPRLALDFTTASLDARVTVARALNTATRVNSSGLIESVNADLPRFDYDPITKLCRGLLIEEQRANIMLRSAEFDLTWVKSNTTVTANAATSPDGTTNADTLDEGTALSVHSVSQAFSAVSGTSYAWSCFVKDLDRRYVQLFFGGAGHPATAFANFDLQTGTIGTVGATAAASITDFGNGWYRCAIVAAANATTAGASAQLGMVTSATSARAENYTGTNKKLYIYGAQVEVGAFATSYIPTVASTVTRNADVVSMTGTNFSSWYNASEGAFLTKFSFPSIPASQFRYVLAANDGTATNFIAIAGNTTSNVPAGRVIASSSTQASMGGGAITANQEAIGVLAYKQDSFAYGQNGATLGTDATGLVPTVNRLDIGALGSSFACAHIQRIAYWPQRIINNETLSFSK